MIIKYNFIGNESKISHHAHDFNCFKSTKRVISRFSLSNLNCEKQFS